MDLNKTAIKVEYKDHGLEIINFYKLHGYLNGKGLTGKTAIGDYYLIKNNNISITCSSPDCIDLSLYKIITINYIGELDIWI
jgi:hypothetical protein